jgi:hypothetical protein
MIHHIRIASLAVAVSVVLGAAQAGAATVSLPLTGIRGGDFIQNYFVGGQDSTHETGPNLGFTFSANAEAQSDTTGTAAGHFEHNPSGLSEVLYFAGSSGANSTAAYMNYATGFDALSFNYSFSNNNNAALPEFAYVYSGLNGAGSLLDTISLTPGAVTAPCTGNHLDSYCTWQSVSTGTFAGVGQSVVFSSATGGAGTSTLTPVTITEFDGVAVTPVPLPATAWLMLSGVAGIFGFARRRAAAV